ncbi:Scr1 family TA system antitoxin-like transcriptional regulator [Streptomyces pratensis]|uniref:Scr1 family TA system antitoxin-like transcriptional regulator n=1 Tax=Streptomyces pratensis TaxID=1169025 RepID=UPI0023689A08|nr:Scr1 family TA system antitoxin-like transcriptional regulator [Streptomyces pratensis]
MPSRARRGTRCFLGVWGWGPDVRRGQLQQLIEMGERGNVTILAIPFERADLPVSGQPIAYATGRDTRGNPGRLVRPACVDQVGR